MEMSGLSRGFSICCLRFKNGVATTPARLASGWLARLYREGVEPSGSLQKVSDHILIPLFWIYPGATKDLPPSLVQLRSAVWTGVTRDTMPLADSCGAAKMTSLDQPQSLGQTGGAWKRILTRAVRVSGLVGVDGRRCRTRVSIERQPRQHPSPSRPKSFARTSERTSPSLLWRLQF